MCFRSCWKVFVYSALVNLAFSHDSETNSPIHDVYDRLLKHFGPSPLRKLYQKCITKDITLEECISVQTVLLLDQIVHKNVIPVSQGIQMVAKKPSFGRSFSRNDVLNQETLEASLPRSIDARQGVLDGLMVDKLTSFLKTHTLNIDLPDARGLRGKAMKLKKMLLPFLVGVIMKGASLLPVILGGMKIIAIKALLASKAALLLTSILGIKKLFYGNNGHGHHKHYIYQQDYGLNSVGHGYTNLIHHSGGVGYDNHGHGYASDLQGVGHRLGEVHGRSFKSLDHNSLENSIQNAKLT